MSEKMKKFLEHATCEDLNKELELNKFELPKKEDLLKYYIKTFDDEQKEEIEGCIETEPEDVFYLIVKGYILEELKIDPVDWITPDMLVEGTLENAIYKAYYEGRKRPWEK